MSQCGTSGTLAQEASKTDPSRHYRLKENSENLIDSSRDFTRGKSPIKKANLKAFIFLHQLLLGEQVLGLDILQTGRSFFTLVETNIETKSLLKKNKSPIIEVNVAYSHTLQKNNSSQHLKQRLKKVKIQKRYLHSFFKKRFAGCMLAGVSQSTVNTQATWCRLIIHQGLKITKKNRVQLVSLYTRLPLLQRQICVVIKIANKTFSTFIVVLQNCAEGYLHVQIMDNVVSRPPKI